MYYVDGERGGGRGEGERGRRKRGRGKRKRGKREGERGEERGGERGGEEGEARDVPSLGISCMVHINQNPGLDIWNYEEGNS